MIKSKLDNGKTFFPGTKVRVFDPRRFKNDRDTPMSVTYRDATVLRWYGKENRFGRYQSLVDVRFAEGRVSEGHFTRNMYILEGTK